MFSQNCKELLNCLEMKWYLRKAQGRGMDKAKLAMI